MLRDPPHYLRPLTSATIPRRLLWLDCAAQTGREQGAYVDRFKVGALGTTHWTSKADKRRDTLSVFHDAQAMWCVAADWCRPGRRVVLWAHDLAYQLRVSECLVHLPALGWHLDRIVLEQTASWALFRQGKRSLMCCDLKSWVNVDLDRLARDLPPSPELAPTPRPSEHPDAAEPLRRAYVVREGVLRILDWIAAEQLGPFRPTGSGQSYSAYRKRFMSHKLLVHDDLDRLGVERAAMWTGRCEAWRHGTLTKGPFVEYDMRAAYTTIAAECEVPTLAGRELRRPKLERLLTLAENHAVLTECEVTTELPLVPTRLGGRTVWPVGTFHTYLWNPELELAAAYGLEVKPGRAWVYHTAPALQDFSRWVLDGMAGAGPNIDPVCQRVLKHWSRCLVGRLGLRYRQWQRFGTCSEPDLRLVTFIDTDEGTSTDLLCAGHDRLILTGMVEALDSLPQIPGWVMSECRARLWRAMMAGGLSNVLYVDTDSMILDTSAPMTHGQWWSERLTGNWAVKGRYDRMTIHGPRNLSTETGRRVSGLPLTARQTAPLEFTGQVMRSIKESMRAGQLDHVASIPRKFVLDAPDLRREHHPGGETAPYRLEAVKAQ